MLTMAPLARRTALTTGVSRSSDAAAAGNGAASRQAETKQASQSSH